MKQTIGVYGTGPIGIGLTTLLTGNGYRTVVIGHTQAGLERCQRGIERNWDELIFRGLAEEENKRSAIALITASNDPASLGDCDVVFEAVSERLAVKNEVYGSIEKCCRSDTIIASCTSSLDADVLAARMRNKERFLIVHPFQPVHLQPLVELVCCAQTDEQVLSRMKQLLECLHRQIIMLNKSIPGFLVNRFAQALYREALYLMEEKIVSAEDIDRAVKYAIGMRYSHIGLMEYFDAVGFELESSIAENVYPTLCNTTKIQTTVLKGLRSGAVGKNAGKGLYQWTQQSSDDYFRRLQEPFISQVCAWDMPGTTTRNVKTE